MAAAIRRGERLRELLKQDRLQPLPARFQLAWLIAFNDGLLDGYAPETLGETLGALAPRVADSELSLDSPREEWLQRLRGWLPGPRGDVSAA